MAPAARPELAAQFAARLLWMEEAPLLPGRRYALRMGTRWTEASVTSIRHRLDVATQSERPARRLELNEIGLCHLSAAQDLPLDAYAANRATGGFILVDTLTNRTVAAGMVAHPLRRAANIHREDFPVDKQARAALAGAAAGGGLVHRPVGLGQVHHRQAGGAGAARGRAAHL